MKNESVWPQVIGIGSTVYDTLMVLDDFPIEDTKIQGLETKIQGGGPCATALVAATKLGISTAYMGTIGDDDFGDFMIKDLEKWGVITKYIRQIPNQVSFHSVVLLNNRNGTRTCIWNKGTVEEPKTKDVRLEVLANAKVLHLDGHMLKSAIYAAKFCNESGIKVSLDGGGMYPGIRGLLPYIDYLITSEKFALGVVNVKKASEAAKMLYDTYKPELVVVTQGEFGGILLDKDGLRRYASFKVKVKDSNGSGDTFHGAFLAGKLKGMNNDSACVFASAASAIKCMHLGARHGMPTDTECSSFLYERGIDLLT